VGKRSARGQPAIAAVEALLGGPGVGGEAGRVTEFGSNGEGGEVIDATEIPEPGGTRV
jgi:hypothetical protein